MLTYGRGAVADLSVLIELLDRGDMASISGFGRVGSGGEEALAEPLSKAKGEFDEDMTLSNLIPSFQAGGDDAWKRSWPLSSARFAVVVLEHFDLTFSLLFGATLTPS